MQIAMSGFQPVMNRTGDASVRRASGLSANASLHALHGSDVVTFSGLRSSGKKEDAIVELAMHSADWWLAQMQAQHPRIQLSKTDQAWVKTSLTGLLSLKFALAGPKSVVSLFRMTSDDILWDSLKQATYGIDGLRSPVSVRDLLPEYGELQIRNGVVLAKRSPDHPVEKVYALPDKLRRAMLG